MKTITISGYLANELNNKEQQKVLQDYHEINVMSDWFEAIVEDFNEDAKSSYGIVATLYFSGFWSQGDGACFVTKTVDTDILIRELHEQGYDIPEDCLIYSKDLSVNIEKVQASFANHYNHENTITACVHSESDVITQHDLDRLEGVITSWAREYSKITYKSLEDYYIDLTSDEAIMETLLDEHNGYLFTKNGTIIPA